ncbi:MAG: cytochrome P450 [bacterium]|nr:cytochrome P450 [bacterium]
MTEQASTTAEAPANPFDDPQVRRCPQAFVKPLQEVTPTIQQDYQGRSSVQVFKHEDVVTVLRNPDKFSNKDSADIGQKRPLIPYQYDPPEHSKFRKLTDPLFSPKRVAEIEGQTREFVCDLIDEVVDKGKVHFHNHIAEPIPSRVFLQLLGLPVSRTKEFIELKDGIIRPPAKSLEERSEMMKATGVKIYALFEEVIEQRLADPQNDMISGFLQSEVDGERLTNEDVEDIGYLFFLAGLDTVTSALDCMLAFLAENEGHRQQIVDDPSIIPSAVEEMLRWEAPVSGVSRVALEDTELSGCPIPKGTIVSSNLISANTDERVWDDAHTINFHRPANKHLAFGTGVHRCLGSHLARMELRVVLEEWHSRVPNYRIPEGLELDYSQGLRQVGNLELEW